jgi:hypothetical protein
MYAINHIKQKHSHNGYKNSILYQSITDFTDRDMNGKSIIEENDTSFSSHLSNAFLRI